MKLSEAIEVLKYLSESIKIGGGKSLIYTRDAEVIDTVVTELEKPFPTDEQIREMSNEYARKHTEPEAGYVLNRRFGFQNGATWMRDLIQERSKK